jgi:hypothetical protein
MDLSVKVAAFCQELGHSTLRVMALQANQGAVYERAAQSVKAGRLGPELEADLDSLDQLVRRATRQGLYPEVTRGFGPLPGYRRETGAQWWTCPRGRCSGRGRVLPGQPPPVCAATGEQLVSGPLSR